MTFKDLLALVLGNLREMKFRTFLTTSGVIIGCIAVVLLVSVAAGLQRMATKDFMRQFGDIANLTIYSSGGPVMMGPGAPMPNADRPEVYLNEEAIAFFKGIKGVQAVVPFSEVTATRIRHKNLNLPANALVGVKKSDFEVLNLKVSKGKKITSTRDVLIGSQAFKEIRFNLPTDRKIKLLGKRVTLFVNKGGENSPDNGMDMGGPTAEAGTKEAANEKKVKVRIAGVLKSKGLGDEDFKIFGSTDLLKKLQKSRFRKDEDRFSKVIIRATSIDAVSGIEKQLRDAGYNVNSIREMLQGMQTFFRVLQAVLGGLGSIALLVASFGIANTMTMAIYERTKEIGIMKAVGASNKDIMGIFLAESAVIGAMGGVLGAFIGFTIGQLANIGITLYLGDGAKDLQAVVYTPLWLVVFVVLFATFVGLISGTIPAMRAAKLSPLAALRHE